MKQGEMTYEYEERAAIKEFCGNLPREVAEKQALEELREREQFTEGRG